MSGSINYGLYVDRESGTFDISIDYYVPGYDDPETGESFYETNWSYYFYDHNSGIGGGGDAADRVRLKQDRADPGVAFGVFADDCRRSVAGAVIDDDDLDIPQRLGQDAIQAFADIGFDIVGGDDDRQSGQGNVLSGSGD